MAKSSGNIRYMFHNLWAFDRKGLFICFLRIPALVALPVVTGLTAKLMIDEINRGISVVNMVLLIAAMSCLIAFLTWIDPFLHEYSRAVSENLNVRYRITAFKKLMETDYEVIEKPENRLKFERAKDFTTGSGGSRQFSNIVVSMGINIVGIFSYIAILSKVNPILLAVLAVCGALNFGAMLLLIISDKRNAEREKPLNLRNEYIFRTAVDFSSAKDIRVYSFKGLFDSFLLKLRRAYLKNFGRMIKANVLNALAVALLSLITEGASLFYLIRSVAVGEMGVSDFIFYFGLITGFWAWILGMTVQINKLTNASIQCGRFRDFLRIGEENEVPSLPVPAEIEEIEFKDVSYSYPGSPEETIKNISFKAKKGEKLAIIGENGAGKTTCIKLLCGFYRPTSGRILLNGVDISGYDKKKYFSLFAAVFQDYNILPMSVEKNISLSEGEADKSVLQKAVLNAGLSGKIDSLKDGLNTRLVKKIYDDAINFSGGETQKLLLARALYRDAPILVLDEPTAALDPISENRMYERYGELTAGKTSFFISHRLSSTRFCDKILFMEKGRITETGAHEELMAKKGGYYRMYEVQSYYYRRGAEN
jgi:ABC-type bacteriocin/lantibiotic exporters, contain an N-terminal double-glycine peptidase domain